ncbi:MAG: antitoxin Xre/MbcA/ParS toxin-binding domain-containing protein [Bacteroidota bacterium]
MSKSENNYSTEYEAPSSVSDVAVAYGNPFKSAGMARNGVAPMLVMDLMDQFKFTKQETAELIDVSSKTLDRHFKAGRAFRGLQSDRILELGNLYNQGVEVFGSQNKFLKWLDSKLPALGNTSPREWLDTQLGIEAISDEIGRIKYGLFA